MSTLLFRKKTLASRLKWAGGVLLITTLLIILYSNKKHIHRGYRHLSKKIVKTRIKPSFFPEGYAIHGIDISHYQPNIDWKRLIAVNQHKDTVRFRFVFIKATEGLILEDLLFDEHWEDAKKHKLIRGAYHYFLPDRSPGLQARNFISSVTLEKGDLPPVVDVEETKDISKKILVARLKILLSDLEKHYKVKPILYSNLYFIEDYLADDFKDYPFWMAHYYRSEPTEVSDIQTIFWQHSDRSDLIGIKGNVDANVFTGSETAMKKLLIK